MSKAMISSRAERLEESVIRHMTRLCAAERGINLAQGFPDFEVDEAIRRAAVDAIERGANQYAITWGAQSLRAAIAAKEKRFRGRELDPDRHITVCCGATEGMVASLLAIVDPGDEVVVFEPFYENYGADVILAGASPRYVRLTSPSSDAEDWSFDRHQLADAFNERTKAIIVNTPHNPTGKVFTRDELEFIAALCQKWDAWAVTDEIYEHIVYDGKEHISLATIGAMEAKTITVNGASKTYAVTGWRIGYIIASEAVTQSIRKLHDFLTVGAPAPLQEAIASAMALPDSFYDRLAREYRIRRDLLLEGLRALGFGAFKPRGAYYLVGRIPESGFTTDRDDSVHLLKDAGVATVPVSSFYLDEPHTGLVRFCFAKKEETIRMALGRLASYVERSTSSRGLSSRLRSSST